MTFNACLLISDDADDHHAFSEALAEISEHSVVLIILDGQRALEFLKTKTFKPQHIFLDLTTQGLRINSFLKAIGSDADLRPVPLTAYGEPGTLDKLEHSDTLLFFDKDYDYSQLKKILSKALKRSKENGK